MFRFILSYASYIYQTFVFRQDGTNMTQRSGVNGSTAGNPSNQTSQAQPASSGNPGNQSQASPTPLEGLMQQLDKVKQQGERYQSIKAEDVIPFLMDTKYFDVKSTSGIGLLI